jgi:hypothetical protein
MKRLLAALLPAESREHVLGDLAERGYRLRDIASVLPRVWFSHCWREISGPAPCLANASEDAIRRRCRQFQARRCYSLVAMILPSVAAGIVRRGDGYWGLLLAAAPLLFLAPSGKSNNPIASRDRWLDLYRAQMIQRLTFSHITVIGFPLMVAIQFLFLLPAVGQLSSPFLGGRSLIWIWSACSLAVFCVGYLVRRRYMQRLRQELANLDRLRDELVKLRNEPSL